jgi:pyrroline-5-carboxylate reductase
MSSKTIGFIGGGRVTRIILNGLRRAGQMPDRVVVSDASAEALSALKADFPNVTVAPNDNRRAAANDLVFAALHPPVLKENLGRIASSLRPDAVLISLAPKLTFATLSEGLGGFQRIVRMNPNAPSIVNSGHNPVAFAPVFTPSEKGELKGIFQLLGACPEVPEEQIEAYAVLTAMGPTYLWFQLYELVNLGKSFGLTTEAVESGIANMVRGAVSTMFESGLSPMQVMELLPTKPLGEEEENIKNIYRTKLTAMYAKLKG